MWPMSQETLILPKGDKMKLAKFTNFYLIALIFLSLLTGLALQGCATQGYENVDTVRKAIFVADAEIRGANLLLRDLVERHVIDTDRANKALQSLRDAHSANQLALDAITLSGDPATAGSHLERVNSALTLALALISTHSDPGGTIP